MVENEASFCIEIANDTFTIDVIGEGDNGIYPGMSFCYNICYNGRIILCIFLQEVEFLTTKIVLFLFLMFKDDNSSDPFPRLYDKLVEICQ